MSGAVRTWNNKCWKCGKLITGDYSWYGEGYMPSILQRSYCEVCYPKVRKQEAEEMDKYIHLKKMIMFRRTIKKMDATNVPMYDYKKAIKVVEDKVKSDPDKFDSSYEIMAAIVLVQNHIYSKMQQKILNYQVDFLLPEIGVVLEIDGEQHKQKKVYDNYRDIDLRNALGPGWDIIHIPTYLMDRDCTKLVDAINKVVESRQNYSNKWKTV